MGRQRKNLKLHKVKGYYSTYRVGGKIRYKYFGTLDSEDAVTKLREWRKLLFGEAVDPDARLAHIGKKKHEALRDFAMYVISLPAGYSGGDRKIEIGIGKHFKRVWSFAEPYKRAKEDVEASKASRRRRTVG